MKFGLAGASRSGKTTWSVGVYARFSNTVYRPELTPAMAEKYLRQGISTQLGFRIGLDQSESAQKIRRIAATWEEDQTVNFPPGTINLDRTQVEVQFDFADIPGQTPLLEERLRTYFRTIEIYDAEGGAFQGRVENSAEILKEMKTVDTLLMFLDCEVLKTVPPAAEMNSEDFARTKRKIALGGMYEVAAELADQLPPGDTLPVAIVLSKMDTCTAEELMRIDDLLFNDQYGIIKLLSAENEKLLICSCPITVVNPVNFHFRPHNLEWPFLFSAAATIFRNAILLSDRATTENTYARSAETRANEYARVAARYDGEAKRITGLPVFTRFFRYLWHNESAKQNRLQAASTRTEAVRHWQEATSYRESSGRKMELSKDDAQLARDTWKLIAAESSSRGLKLYKAGVRQEEILAREI